MGYMHSVWLFSFIQSSATGNGTKLDFCIKEVSMILLDVVRFIRQVALQDQSEVLLRERVITDLMMFSSLSFLLQRVELGCKNKIKKHLKRYKMLKNLKKSKNQLRRVVLRCKMFKASKLTLLSCSINLIVIWKKKVLCFSRQEPSSYGWHGYFLMVAALNVSTDRAYFHQNLLKTRYFLEQHRVLLFFL